MISSVSHMQPQGLASRSTKNTLRIFQQSNSLGTLRKILHTYGLPNRWEVGGEMTLGNHAQVVGPVAALAGSPHADFFAVRSGRETG